MIRHNMGCRGILSLFVAAVLVATVGCSKKKESAFRSDNRARVEKDLKFESFSYDVIVAVPDSNTIDSNPSSKYVRYTCEGVLPETLGDDNVRNLRDSLMSMAGLRYADDSMPSPIIGEGDSITNLNPLSTDACGAFIVKLSASLINPRVVVFDCYNESYFCGAAHGLYGIGALNYDISNGKILELGDIIADGKENELLKAVRKNLAGMKRSLYVSDSDIQLPEQFKIVGNGLEFIYQPYEIASYSEGVITVPVGLDVLDGQNLFTPEGKYIFYGDTVETAPEHK